MPSGKSPESDVSPRTQTDRSPRSPTSNGNDYFSAKGGAARPTEMIAFRAPDGEKRQSNHGSVDSTSSLPTASNHQHKSSGASTADEPGTPDGGRRRSSVAFRAPGNPSLPQGHMRKTDSLRLRASSPPAAHRFKQHVAFDNLPVGDATKNNTSSYTLNSRHQGYHPNRRSRTFMVGVDEHTYSDYALVWLMDKLVDDGDEVVCVRVIDSPVRATEKVYQEDAKRMLKSIQEKNTHDRAICIILEYAVGKLHATFQHLIQIYQPSMLIVGTRGRSLGGIQGLVNSRNSFSKYCLQYSPVPVVVVRPDEKRRKKLDKRKADPTRQNYLSMLARNEGRHEADSENSSLYEMEAPLSADQEAHKVATALALPAQFDPLLKPIDPSAFMLHRTAARQSSVGSASGMPAALPSPPPTSSSNDRLLQVEPENSATALRRPSNTTASTGNESGEEESGEEEEDEFEVLPARLALESSQKKKRLHAMEVGEAAALLKLGPGMGLDEEDEDEEDEDEDEVEGNGEAAGNSKS